MTRVSSNTTTANAPVVQSNSRRVGAKCPSGPMANSSTRYPAQTRTLLRSMAARDMLSLSSPLQTGDQRLIDLSAAKNAAKNQDRHAPEPQVIAPAKIPLLPKTHERSAT